MCWFGGKNIINPEFEIVVETLIGNVQYEGEKLKVELRGEITICLPIKYREVTPEAKEMHLQGKIIKGEQKTKSRHS